MSSSAPKINRKTAVRFRFTWHRFVIEYVISGQFVKRAESVLRKHRGVRMFHLFLLKNTEILTHLGCYLIRQYTGFASWVSYYSGGYQQWKVRHSPRSFCTMLAAIGWYLSLYFSKVAMAKSWSTVFSSLYEGLTYFILPTVPSQSLRAW